MEGALLVVGATGTVGRHVVAGLLRAGAPVRAAMALPDRSDAPAELGAAERVRFDVHDQAGWPVALDGVDRVFLIRPPAVSDAAGVLGPLVEQLAARGLRQVVFLSVVGVNPALPHWRTERDLQRHGVPSTLLRAAFFMQNLETAYRDDVRDRSRIRLPAGRGRTAFVDTRDVAALAVLALQQPERYGGRAYTCTGGQALSWQQVADTLTEELGRPVGYQRAGLLAYRRELLAAGHPPAYVRVQLVIALVARLGLAARTSDDMPIALGHRATTLQQYVRDARHVWNPTPDPGLGHTRGYA